MKADHVALEKERWPGGPMICPAENLPAFQTLKAWKDFQTKYCPSGKVLEEWKCAACGHYHAATIAPDPAGSSSGHGRSSKFKTRQEFHLYIGLPGTLQELLAFMDDKKGK